MTPQHTSPSILVGHAMALLLVASLPLHAQTWDGNGSADSSGNWSTTTNWTLDTVPGSGNTATLDNVSSGTRTVTYDAAASGSLGTLQMNQTTAGAINLLDIQKSLSISSDLILGASGGTVQVTANGVSLSTTGITLNTNSVLSLVAASSFTTNLSIGSGSGTLTISGGTLQAAPASGSWVSAVNGNLTMSSGSILIDNSSGAADRRLRINGNVNITGGTVSSSATSGQLQLNGASNIFNPTTMDADLRLNLTSSGDQSLTTNQVIAGGVFLSGSGVKTVTSTGSSIGSISIFDSDSSDLVSTTLRLGSDLNMGSALVTAGTFSQPGTNVQVGIDTNGYTLDMSGSTWTPNLGQSKPTTWTLSGNGVIKANRFVFNTANVTTNVGSGTTLEATGGNGLTSTLSGTGAFDANSTFRYSGTASTSDPYHLVSNRAVGNVEVTNGGALRIDNTSGFAMQGAARVANGTLIFDTGVDTSGATGFELGARGVLDVTAQSTFTMLSTQTFTFELDGTGGGSAGLLSAAGLDITNGSVAFTVSGVLDDQAYLIASYTSVSGTAFASVSDLPTGYTLDYNYLGGNQIALVATAVPEPGSVALLLGGISLMFVVTSRRGASRRG